MDPAAADPLGMPTVEQPADQDTTTLGLRVAAIFVVLAAGFLGALPSLFISVSISCAELCLCQCLVFAIVPLPAAVAMQAVSALQPQPLLQPDACSRLAVMLLLCSACSVVSLLAAAATSPVALRLCL